MPAVADPPGLADQVVTGPEPPPDPPGAQRPEQSADGQPQGDGDPAAAPPGQQEGAERGQDPGAQADEHEHGVGPGPLLALGVHVEDPVPVHHQRHLRRQPGPQPGHHQSDHQAGDDHARPEPYLRQQPLHQ